MKLRASAAFCALAILWSAPCSTNGAAELEAGVSGSSSSTNLGHVTPGPLNQVDVSRLVELLTDRKADLPTPEGLKKRYESIALSTHEKTESYWVMRAPAHPPFLRWALAEFQPGDQPNSWLFVDLVIGVGSGATESQATLFKSLESQIRKRLGKVSFRGQNDKAKQLYWRMGRGLEFMLGRGLLRNGVTAEDEEQIVLSLHVPQGDPD